jgi:hypothetical protein
MHLNRAAQPATVTLGHRLFQLWFAMGVSLEPVFEPWVSFLDYGDNGKVLLAELGVLDRLADDFGFARLSSFADRRFLNDEAACENPEEILELCEDWFLPAACLLTIENLLAAIETHVVGWNHFGQEDVSEALMHLQQWLQKSVERQARFRLEVHP